MGGSLFPLEIYGTWGAQRRVRRAVGPGRGEFNRDWKRKNEGLRVKGWGKEVGSGWNVRGGMDAASPGSFGGWEARSLKIRGRGNNPRSCEQILGLAHAKNYTLSRHHWRLKGVGVGRIGHIRQLDLTESSIIGGVNNFHNVDPSLMRRMSFSRWESPLPWWQRGQIHAAKWRAVRQQELAGRL